MSSRPRQAVPVRTIQRGDVEFYTLIQNEYGDSDDTVLSDPARGHLTDVRDTSGFKHRGMEYALMTFELAEPFGVAHYIPFTPFEHTWGTGLQRNDAFVGADTQRFRDFRDGYLLVKGDVLFQYFIGGGDEYFNEESWLMDMVVRGATVSKDDRARLIHMILHQYEGTGTDEETDSGTDDDDEPDDGYPRTYEEAELYLDALIHTPVSLQTDGDPSAADDEARRVVIRARKQKKRPKSAMKGRREKRRR